MKWKEGHDVWPVVHMQARSSGQFIEIEVLLLYSQQYDTRPYLVPQRSSHRPRPISWRYILILFFHVGLSFQSTVFIQVSQQNSIVWFFSFFVDEISVPWNLCYIVWWNVNMFRINILPASSSQSSTLKKERINSPRHLQISTRQHEDIFE